MPEQPELTIQGWGPTGPGAPPEQDGDLSSTMPKAARRYLAKELGWTEKMNGEQLGALWFAGIVVVLMVVAFGAVGIHALLT